MNLLLFDSIQLQLLSFMIPYLCKMTLMISQLPHPNTALLTLKCNVFIQKIPCDHFFTLLGFTTFQHNMDTAESANTKIMLFINLIGPDHVYCYTIGKQY